MHTNIITDKGLFVQANELNLDAIRKNWFHDFEGDDEDLMDEIFSEPLEDGSLCIIGKPCYGNDFEGDVSSLLDPDLTLALSTEPDDWLIMQLSRFPQLFTAASENEAALIQEMREMYSPYLSAPDRFDFRGRLVALRGVTWY